MVDLLVKKGGLVCVLLKIIIGGNVRGFKGCLIFYSMVGWVKGSLLSIGGLYLIIWGVMLIRGGWFVWIGVLCVYLGDD